MFVVFSGENPIYYVSSREEADESIHQIAVETLSKLRGEKPGWVDVFMRKGGNESINIYRRYLGVIYNSKKELVLTVYYKEVAKKEDTESVPPSPPSQVIAPNFDNMGNQVPKVYGGPFSSFRIRPPIGPIDEKLLSPNIREMEE